MKILLKDASIINEGRIFESSILIIDEIIAEIAKEIKITETKFDKVIDCKGKYIIPGVIDDQVHFREPGLTHKGDIYSESKAAVAGGITSFMEMPNTNPQTVTNKLLDEKHKIASENSLANYSFYLGATNDNIAELKSIDETKVCGVKIFMGSSTGNMLVDNVDTLSEIFSSVKIPIAVHCEDEGIIKSNTQHYKEIYGENIPVNLHSLIRSEKACYKCSAFAVDLAKKYNTRLHLLHLSTASELNLLSSDNVKNKRITSEVCIHHLWFEDSDYDKYGVKIKWNPSIKTKNDRDKLIEAVNNNEIDIVATDHAPHLIEEKNNLYFKSPSGGPLVQHSLVAMLEMYHQKKFSLEKIVEKMCHTPAELFNIFNRGFIRTGYFADLTILDLNSEWTVSKENILYKCKWSPFEGVNFHSKITHTIINGNIVYDNGTFYEDKKGLPLTFNR
ncbi:MAG TPA: dihydroorotase [Bacteroidales bacterium]|nr:MAG: dihydroorotase [Bacteroidetes bacterium GWF2_33_38]OFY85765.1 MAG: dihydroorotase [Bacteroidetes bacterium RIFOXYA2_FULL_33_7]HBF88421.1 dihydroorotase [Bacteroidales bacterium]